MSITQVICVIVLLYGLFCLTHQTWLRIRLNRQQRRARSRSAWFEGLLDAEAGESVEPQDWDDEVFPGYWREYAQGAFDYRRHMEERL